MVDAVHLGQAAEDAAADTAGHRTRRHAHTHSEGHAGFQHALLRAFHGKVATGRFLGGVHRAVARVPATAKPTTAPEKPTISLPAESVHALSQAMTHEGVPASWQPSLAYIMAQESGGRVGVHSPIHSARGLYQLTAANYHYNPNGAASFGNAVEEAQGGIRYIRARYGTADNAAAFWRQHQWY
jgi:hypothetical protein